MTSKQQLIFGIHAVESLLQNQPQRVLRVCVQKERHDKKLDAISKMAKQHRIRIEQLSKRELDELTDEATHQGVIAVCKPAAVYSEQDLHSILKDISNPLILILDGVQDPHNLGACFRSADAAGVNLIIAPKDKSVGITPVVSKVASGAVETVPFLQVTNLVRVMEELKAMNIWLYGAAAEAEKTIYQTNFKGPAAIVLGAEGSGLRRLTREHCDALIKIPMLGAVESLNVSVATGIILFEVVRQRVSS